LGHGEGYRYPHDEPGGWVDQEHRPDEVAGRRYWQPSGRGADVEGGATGSDSEPRDDHDRN
jgi:putative ATPase